MSGRIEKDSRFLLAERYIQETGISVFLTGKAGTGKTTFLKHIVAGCSKRLAVVAPTGVAAVNAGGVTIHSFFQLPLCPYLPDVKELVTEYQMPEKNRSLRKDRVKILRTLELLIIDEISMVRADILDAIDATLKRYRKNDRPFGGVQLLMIGDVQQLPPVVTESEKPFMDQVYPSPFFFNSRAFRKLGYIVIELNKIHRQRDAEFTSMLNDIRTGNPSDQTLERLNRRLDPGFDPPSGEYWIRLTTHNHQSDAINREKMDALKGKSMIFKAEIDGNYPESAYPAETELRLKKGAQVMFTRNDTSGSSMYFNGKIGTVTELDPEIIVTDENGNEIIVNQEKWDNVRYEINPETQEIQAVNDGSFTQYPLRAAWAITIHKSQGLTFDRVIIDAGRAFSFGQVYVALSRCRSLEGIVLTTPITRRCTFRNTEVAIFENGYTPENQAVENFDNYRESYLVDKICSTFSLGRIASLSLKLEKLWKGSLGSVYPKISARFTALVTGQDEDFSGVEAIASVGTRFQSQIREIFADQSRCTEDRDAFVNERISKACAYFTAQLGYYAKAIAPTCLVEIENKETQKVFKNIAEELLKELIFRLSLYRATMADGFSVKLYSRVATECELEKTGTLKSCVRRIISASRAAADKDGGNAGTDKANGKKEVQESGMDADTSDIDTEYDEATEKLLKVLKAWRKMKYEELHLPAFMIMHQKVLVQIAEEKPASREELMQINGFGKKQWDKYGEEILEIIEEYHN
ncbi:MAG: AAA family ATPase [Bacteroidales bacterium]|nr:AAA family ATPase [Bacteroidales bacterium]MDY5780363.1 AAA family ATPase [Candidatus Cryptobacteroides sp.]